MPKLPSALPVAPPRVEALADIHLLKVFSNDELLELMHAGETIKTESHSNIVIEGELSWGLFLILSGNVLISKTNKLTGDSYDVAQLGKGNFFGEMSLVDENPRSATVKALSDCELFSISKVAFYNFLNKSPDRKVRFFESCTRSLVMRLRDLGDDYVISQYQLWKVALKRDPLSKESEAA